MGDFALDLAKDLIIGVIGGLLVLLAEKLRSRSRKLHFNCVALRSVLLRAELSFNPDWRNSTNPWVVFGIRAGAISTPAEVDWQKLIYDCEDLRTDFRLLKTGILSCLPQYRRVFCVDRELVSNHLKDIDSAFTKEDKYGIIQCVSDAIKILWETRKKHETYVSGVKGFRSIEGKEEYKDMLPMFRESLERSEGELADCHRKLSKHRKYVENIINKIHFVDFSKLEN